MPRLILLITIPVLAWLLTGCAGLSGSGPLIEYRRSGGFAGSNDRLVIEEDGRAIVTRNGRQIEFTVDAETLEQLEAVFQEADYASLRREYLPAEQRSDYLDYVIAYKGQRVHTMDTAVPDELWPVIQSLNQIMDSASPGG